MRLLWLGMVAMLLSGCGGSMEGSGTAAAPPAQEQVAARTEQLTLHLKAGWNAVGFRCSEVTSLTPDPALAGLAWWDGRAYQTGGVTAADVNRAGVTHGFYVYATAATVLSYAGPSRTSGERLGMRLDGGWNFVSFPTEAYDLRCSDGQAEVAADSLVLGLDRPLPGVPRWIYAPRQMVLSYCTTPPAPSPAVSPATLVQPSPSPEAPAPSPSPVEVLSPSPSPGGPPTGGGGGVTHAPPSVSLVFETQPLAVTPGVPFSVEVRVQGSMEPLTLTLGLGEAPEGSTLEGAAAVMTDETGLARFENLTLSEAGTVRLRAVCGAWSAESAAIEVVP